MRVTWEFSAVACIVTTFCIAATISDLRSGRIYDRTSIAAGGAILVVSLIGGSITSAAVGAVVTSLPLAAMWFGSAGRMLGFGDVKAVAVIGAGLGWQLASLAIGAAFVTGACFAFAGICSGRLDRKSALPFAPFLTAGVLFALLFDRMVRI